MAGDVPYWWGQGPQYPTCYAPQPLYQTWAPPPVQLTLRDLLAAAALPAIYEHHTMFTDRAAELAYEQADEMLKAREEANAALHEGEKK